VHELALARRICEIAQASLPPGERVVRILVEVGALAGVVPEALQTCFGVVSEHYAMGGALLDLRRLEAKASCASCEAHFSVDTMWARCPGCGHSPVTVEGGRELRVKELEVDDV